MSPRKSPTGSKARAYWQKRLSSEEFRDLFTEALEHEIAALSGKRIRDLVDARKVRQLISESDPFLVSRETIADLVHRLGTSVAGRLATDRESILEVLDDAMRARIASLLREDLVLSRPMKAFIASVMEQEFVQSLFTNIIYTSIVSFNQKVNPIFGRMALMAVEGQIKGFIRLFMPMVQQQAIAFATSRRNQAIFFDFMRAIVDHLLNQPIHSFLSVVSQKQKKKAEDIVRHAIRNPSVDALARKAVLAFWDDLYMALKDRKLGELLSLDANGRWVAEQCAALLFPIFTRPGLVSLVIREITLAATPKREKL